MKRHPATIVRVLLLLALLLSVTGGLASADGSTTCAPADKPLAQGSVTVQGWVINHRETPVDGTRTPSPLTLTATASDGAVVTATADSSGFFKFSLTPDVWNFQMQLPADWDGIVPRATRAGLAQTGCTPLPGRSTPYLIVFKIRRLFDVTAVKWEELAGGTVQPGAGWTVTFQPVNDPFAVLRSGQTSASGTTTATLTPGSWRIYETLKSGWTPVTPSSVWITLDQYAPVGAMDPVVFKNRIAQ